MSAKQIWDWIKNRSKGETLTAAILLALVYFNPSLRSALGKNLRGIFFEIRAFLKTIDGWARVALRMIFFWPLVLLLLAMLLSREHALVYLSIASLVPALIVAYVYTNRFSLTVMATLTKLGRGIIDWSLRFVGISLFGGFVFALIPIANDRDLGPLLFLSIVVIFWPIHGSPGMKKWIKNSATLAAFGIMLVLILGGRNKAYNKINNVGGSITNGSVFAGTNTYPTYNSNLDCVDGFGKVNDLHALPGSSPVQLTAPIGCWGETNILPDAINAQGGCFQPDPSTDANPQWVVWLKFHLKDGSTKIMGPYNWDMTNAANRPVLSNMGVIIQVQGAPLPNGHAPGILFRLGHANAQGYCIS